MNNFRSIIVIVHCLLLTAHCFAWDETGHRAVAEVAESFLEPEARAAVRELLGGQPLADVANWADEIKSLPQYQASRPLHYAFVPAGTQRFDAKRDCAAEGCVVGAIGLYRDKILDEKLPQTERADALKYLAHFVGELHQPLHLGRIEDRGGADLAVNFYGRPFDLLRVWDEEMIRVSEPDWRKLAGRLVRDITAPDLQRWRRGSLEDWATESLRIAEQFAYADAAGRPIVNGAELDGAYFARAEPAMLAQLRKAGVRLALLLNTVYGKEKFVPAEFAGQMNDEKKAPPETPLERFRRLAVRLPAGSFPAWLLAEESESAVSGIPGGGVRGLIDADGRISPVSQAFNITPLIFLRQETREQDAPATNSSKHDAPSAGIDSDALTSAGLRETRVLTAKDFATTHSLMDGWAPLPAVQWMSSDSLCLGVELLTTTESLLLAQYTLENKSDQPASGTLLLIVRPLKFEAQLRQSGFFRSQADHHAADNVTSITLARFAEQGRRLELNGAQEILSSVEPSLYLAGADFSNDVQERIARGDAAVEEASDAEGLLSAALRFDVTLAANEQWQLTLALPDAASSVTATTDPQTLDFDLLRDELYFRWKDWTGDWDLATPQTQLTTEVFANPAASGNRDWNLETPDPRLATIVRANLAALLLRPAELLRHAEPLLQFGCVEPVRRQLELLGDANSDSDSRMLLEPVLLYLKYTGDKEFAGQFWPRLLSGAQLLRDEMTSSSFSFERRTALAQTLQLGIQLGHAGEVEWIREYAKMTGAGIESATEVSAVVSAMYAGSNWGFLSEMFRVMSETRSRMSNWQNQDFVLLDMHLLLENDVWNREPDERMQHRNTKSLLLNARSLFVQEQDNKLLLAPDMPQAWIDAGVRVRNLRTWWGPVSYELHNKPGIGNVLVLTCKEQPPKGFVVPQGMQLFVITE